ncbi:hypothetical protein VP1G_01047 [Cytospora mali]|uniref:Uncharacterized protein n=1 Tax=Cytospora mali TaxID=578113 RepID=A0A194UPP1_CYTMA|nr:hypothetical protein VP1G_01047 [Valsa mali var. pyri (nom. inval.)]
MLRGSEYKILFEYHVRAFYSSYIDFIYYLDEMANITSVGLDLLVMLPMALFIALTGASVFPTYEITAATGCLDNTNVTATASAALMPRGGTAEHLPDNGDGPSPSGSHLSGGPYTYGDYWYYCGNFATGDREDLNTGEEKLMDDVRYNDCWAPANGCLRLFCYETSAIYLCNDNDHELDISCYNDGYLARRIREACCPSAGISGQMFHPTDNYNVVVGYGNCNHNLLVPPYAPGLGNNYACNNEGGGF